LKILFSFLAGRGGDLLDVYQFLTTNGSTVLFVDEAAAFGESYLLDATGRRLCVFMM
jgi:hypothetical protein